MVSVPISFAKTPVGELHRRRVRVMLWSVAGFLNVLGLGWAIFFGLHQAWGLVAMDIAMMSMGICIGVLTHKKRTRLAFFLMAGSMFWVICSICVLFDVPTPAAPRSNHHFLLVLSVASLLVLRDDRLALRLVVTGSCLVAFVVLASSNWGVNPQFALPDKIRVPGTWVNNTLSALGLYALIHILITDIAEHSSMEIELSKALVHREFFLVYQPQVTSDGQVFGAEALVRWQHPKLGVVPPSNFIPLAESSDLIVPLGAWVLDTACAQLVDWSKVASLAHLTLSVNVSVQQFRQPDYVEQVRSVLERTGVDPRRLKLELTESSLAHDMEDIISKMVALKSIGVGFSLDDFGTGYSSLNYLKRLPLDQLKIDQSFVRDVLTDAHDASIARMVIALGKSLGFSVIAEGVETQGQRDFLTENDCHLFQGYLFSKPLSLSAFEHYVCKA